MTPELKQLNRTENSWSVIITHLRNELMKRVTSKIAEAFLISPEEVYSLADHMPIIFMDQIPQATAVKLKTYFESLGIDVLLTNDESIKNKSYRLNWSEPPNLSFLSQANPLAVVAETPGVTKNYLIQEAKRLQNGSENLRISLVKAEAENEKLRQELTHEKQSMADAASKLQSLEEKIRIVGALYEEEQSLREQNERYISSLEREKEELAEKNVFSQREIRVQKIKIEQTEEILQQTRKEKEDFDQRLKERVNAINEADKQKSLLIENLNSLQNELSAFKTESQELKEALQKKGQVIQDFEKNLRDRADALKNSHEKISNLEKANSDLNAKVADLSREAEGWRAKTSELSQEIRSIEVVRVKTEQKLKAQVKETELSLAKWADLEKMKNVLESACIEYEQTLQSKELQIQEYRKNNEDFQRSSDDLMRTVSELENEAEKRKKLIQELNDKIRSLETFYQEEQALRNNAEHQFQLMDQINKGLEIKAAEYINEAEVFKVRAYQHSEKIRLLEENEEKLKSKLVGKEVELEGRRQQVEELEAAKVQLNGLHLKINDLTNSNQLLGEKLNNQTQELRLWENKLLETESEKIQTEEKLAKARESLDSIEPRTDHLRDQIEVLCSEKENLQAELNSKNEKLDQAEAANKQLNEQIENLRADFYHEQASRIKSEQYQRDLETAMGQLSRKVGTFSEEITAFQIQAHDLNEKVQFLDEEKTEAEKVFNEKMRVFETANAQLQDKLAHASNRIERYELQSVQYEERMKALESAKKVAEDGFYLKIVELETRNQKYKELAEKLKLLDQSYQVRLEEIKNEFTDRLAASDREKEFHKARIKELTEQMTGFGETKRKLEKERDVERDKLTSTAPKVTGFKIQEDALHHFRLLDEAYKEIEEWKQKADKLAEKVEDFEKIKRRIMLEYNSKIEEIDYPKARSKNPETDVRALKQFYNTLGEF